MSRFGARYATLIAAQRMPLNDAMGFDAHALAAAIAAAGDDVPIGGDGLPARLGLTGPAVAEVMARVFPWLLRGEHEIWRAEQPGFCDEHAMLSELLLAHAEPDSPIACWLAPILARRSLEPGHLWQALGLSSRAELRRLLETHFPTLAARNTLNLRWKRFFYRELCAAQGFVACPVPDCRDCSSHAECFAPVEGEGRLAA